MEDSSSLPLSQYIKNVPPGWKAGLPNYPLSRYNQLIQIWYRLTDFSDDQVGPAVAGRLQGRANSLALELRITRQDGTVLAGDSALAFPGEPATQHAAAVKGGLQALLEVLGRHDVVGTGWKGVNVNVDDGWRSFDAAEVGEVDAILGYLMALKREAIEVVRPDPKARFYRNADMEWSLALREAGGILAIPADSLPIRQGRHHGYHDSDPAFRDKQSKKTYDRLLQRFRGKDHLLAPR